MSASLIYHWRRGLLTAVAAGRMFHLRTYQPPSSSQGWDKVQEFRSGKLTLWDHCFDLPAARRGAINRAIPGTARVGAVIHRIGIEAVGIQKLETYDYPGKDAQPFSRVNPRGGCSLHRHRGAVVYVGGQHGGLHIHGWPPCNLRTCVVVTERWEQLFEAIAQEEGLSFSIAQ